MAHPMGMYIRNLPMPMGMGMKVRGFGMRVQGYGAEPQMGMKVQGYGMRVQGFGDQAQMGDDIFSTLINNLSSSAQKGLTSAANQAIASTLKTVVSDPTVQQAVVASGNDAAIQNLATQLKTAQAAALANPWTTAALVGGLGLGAIFLFKAISK